METFWGKEAVFSLFICFSTSQGVWIHLFRNYWVQNVDLDNFWGTAQNCRNTSLASKSVRVFLLLLRLTTFKEVQIQMLVLTEVWPPTHIHRQTSFRVFDNRSDFTSAIKTLRDLSPTHLRVSCIASTCFYSVNWLKVIFSLNRSSASRWKYVGICALAFSLLEIHCFKVKDPEKSWIPVVGCQQRLAKFSDFRLKGPKASVFCLTYNGN